MSSGLRASAAEPSAGGGAVAPRMNFCVTLCCFDSVSLSQVLAYFISPWDLIPDSVPVVGLLDDLFFFVFVLVGFSWLTRRYRDDI
jgi:NADH:ubiquinone oxidoreductase subunit 3 (subunit A)